MNGDLDLSICAIVHDVHLLCYPFALCLCFVADVCTAGKMTIALLAKYLNRRCSQCCEPQTIHAQSRFFKRPPKIGVGKADASDQIDKVVSPPFLLRLK